MVHESDDRGSSAIDSDSGKQELKNERPLIEIRSVLSSHSQLLNHDLKSELRLWCENEERMNKDAREYGISWKKLETIIEKEPALRLLLLNGCEDFRNHAADVESGNIVPTPKPPASVVVTRQQEGVKRNVAGIYGRRASQGIHKIDGSPISSRRRPSGKMSKVGNGGPKE